MPMLRAAIALATIVLAPIVEAKEPFSATLEGRLPSGRTYRLELHESAYVPRPGENEDDGSRWGIDGGFPETYVSRFRLTVNGKEVTIPRKLFEDLSHVNRVDVAEDKRAVRVRVQGGDGAGSFDAVYLFRIPRQIERTVRMG